MGREKRITGYLRSEVEPIKLGKKNTRRNITWLQLKGCFSTERTHAADLLVRSELIITRQREWFS